MIHVLVSALASAACISAYPGMASLLPGLHARAAANPSTTLIGDLASLSESQMSLTGLTVSQILSGQAPGQLPALNPYSPPGPCDSPACARDTCCVWHYVAQDMTASFRGSSGRCNDLARQAIRLGFHDAAGWSLATGPGGGADGSIVLAPEEMARPGNRGLEDIVAQMKLWHMNHPTVSMADLIQFGAITATVVCPLGPQVRFFAGRPDSDKPAVDGLLPGAFESADVLVERFQNMTISPAGLVALVGAHTTSQQRFVDVSRRGDPQDSTPGVWDTAFYGQTLGGAPSRVFKFQSDLKLAQAYTGEWQSFEGPSGQGLWNAAFAREYVRLSLLGVYNINSLTECTKVLPQPTTSFTPSDQSAVNMWMSSDVQSMPVAQTMMNGGLLSDVISSITGMVGGFLGKREGEVEA